MIIGMSYPKDVRIEVVRRWFLHRSYKDQKTKKTCFDRNGNKISKTRDAWGIGVAIIVRRIKTDDEGEVVLNKQKDGVLEETRIYWGGFITERKRK